MKNLSEAKQDLTRLERQVMDIVYAAEKVSVAGVQTELPGEPSYSATRMLLQRLQKKGLVSFEMDGPKYIYSPVTPRAHAGNAAWSRLVQTFFGGSTANAFSALLGESSETLSDQELDDLEKMVAQAKAKRR